jgi:hypothetical protein
MNGNITKLATIVLEQLLKYFLLVGHVKPYIQVIREKL